MKLTSIQKLDRTLTFMSGNNYIDKKDFDLYRSLEQVTVDLIVADKASTINDAILILDKLVKDGYVNIPAGVGHPMARDEVYYISFGGKVFIEQGGYNQQKINHDAENNRLDALESYHTVLTEKLNSLTFWIAAGTCSLVILEALRMLNEHFHLLK